MAPSDSAPAAVLPDLQAAGEPPAVACATRMKALEQEVLVLRLLHALAGPCNSQGLDCVARKFRKVFRKARGTYNFAKHVELTMTRVTTHTGQPGSLAPARVTRSSPQSFTLLSPPRSPQPESLAAARRHPQRPADTCRGPSQ